MQSDALTLAKISIEDENIKKLDDTVEYANFYSIRIFYKKLFKCFKILKHSFLYAYRMSDEKKTMNWLWLFHNCILIYDSSDITRTLKSTSSISHSEWYVKWRSIMKDCERRIYVPLWETSVASIHLTGSRWFNKILLKISEVPRLQGAVCRSPIPGNCSSNITLETCFDILTNMLTSFFTSFRIEESRYIFKSAVYWIHVPPCLPLSNGKIRVLSRSE